MNKKHVMYLIVSTLLGITLFTVIFFIVGILYVYANFIVAFIIFTLLSLIALSSFTKRSPTRNFLKKITGDAK